MHPEVSEPSAACRFSLRDLISVMNGNVILSTTMDIK